MADKIDHYHVWLGIPPAQQPPNHYRLLGLELFESSADVIDASASRQTAYLHQLASGPDRKASQRILTEVAAARRCLLDEKSKQKYDAKLKEQSAPAVAPDTAPPNADSKAISNPSVDNSSSTRQSTRKQPRSGERSGKKKPTPEIVPLPKIDVAPGHTVASKIDVTPEIRIDPKPAGKAALDRKRKPGRSKASKPQKLPLIVIAAVACMVVVASMAYFLSGRSDDVATADASPSIASVELTSLPGMNAATGFRQSSSVDNKMGSNGKSSGSTTAKPKRKSKRAAKKQNDSSDSAKAKVAAKPGTAKPAVPRPTSFQVLRFASVEDLIKGSPAKSLGRCPGGTVAIMSDGKAIYRVDGNGSLFKYKSLDWKTKPQKVGKAGSKNFTAGVMSDGEAWYVHYNRKNSRFPWRALVKYETTKDLLAGTNGELVAAGARESVTLMSDGKHFFKLEKDGALKQAATAEELIKKPGQLKGSVTASGRHTKLFSDGTYYYLLKPLAAKT